LLFLGHDVQTANARWPSKGSEAVEFGLDFLKKETKIAPWA